ncbi:phage tail tube protein [Salmonella enterica]
MSSYYYGQGKVYLARRDHPPLAWRWVGDVGELTITLNTETRNQQGSVNGRISTINRHAINEECRVEAVWYERSCDNLAAILYGDCIIRRAQYINNEAIPVGVTAGNRYVLENQNIWDVAIPGLIEGSDYRLDALWGAIEFLKTPVIQPVVVSYKHAGSTSIPIYTRPPIELALRYEGVNQAESDSPVLVELYRLQFDAAVAIELINNSSELARLETTAEVLADINRSVDEMGRYGRFVTIGKLDESVCGKLMPILTTGTIGGEITEIHPYHV